MSFLFEDDTLITFLDKSGLLDKLNKYAQQTDNDVKLVAMKLAQKLGEEVTGNHGTDDTEIYVKDLVSLEAYLNYLYKNKKTSNDGHSLVLQSVGINGQQPGEKDKHLYMPYNGFFVYVSEVAGLINGLVIESEKKGNEVMKPLVKGLKTEATKAFGDAFTAHEQDSTDPNALPVTQNTLYMKSKNTPNADDQNSKNVSFKTKEKSGTTVQQDLASLRNVLPFQGSTSLSPYSMMFFIQSMNEILQKSYTQGINLHAGSLLGDFTEYYSSISRSYAEWMNFCAQASAVGPNANTARNKVPYDLSGRPFTGLESIFGNTPNAKLAAQRLLQMVNLTKQSLLSIQDSIDLMNILGKDIVSNQIRQAESFTNNLSTVSR